MISWIQRKPNSHTHLTEAACEASQNVIESSLSWCIVHLTIPVGEHHRLVRILATHFTYMVTIDQNRKQTYRQLTPATMKAGNSIRFDGFSAFTTLSYTITLRPVVKHCLKGQIKSIGIG